jgi:hypothetical protein
VGTARASAGARWGAELSAGARTSLRSAALGGVLLRLTTWMPTAPELVAGVASAGAPVGGESGSAPGDEITGPVMEPRSGRDVAG